MLILFTWFVAWWRQVALSCSQLHVRSEHTWGIEAQLSVDLCMIRIADLHQHLRVSDRRSNQLSSLLLLYRNVELLFVNTFYRISRHIQKTGISIHIGSIIDFDNDDNITTNTMWNGENSLTCLQLYDVALNEAQIKRSRDLCQKGGKLCSSSNTEIWGLC